MRLKHKSNTCNGGFIFIVLLIVMIIIECGASKFVLNVMMAIKREREEELVFCGESIAKAINLYRNKVGDYPKSLCDLLVVKPKIIRKLYKDPMTIGSYYNGEWDLLYTDCLNNKGEKCIIGVRSFCTQNSLKHYGNQRSTLIRDWVFRAEL